MTAPDLQASDAFARTLEREGLSRLPAASFVLTREETALVSPAFSNGRAKTISLGPSGDVRGAAPVRTPGFAWRP